RYIKCLNDSLELSKLLVSLAIKQN
ncbi:MAG: hypothetical protein RLZZ293_1010, partial [Pseudomonadota bacterium]